MLLASVVVVYHLVPTSNHNEVDCKAIRHMVVYHLVPTSNHNYMAMNQLTNGLFIILFLHQTTTFRVLLPPWLCCLSSCSYIKPQRSMRYHSTRVGCLSSCSYIKPQPMIEKMNAESVVYHLVPTSNHNVQKILLGDSTVVYHLVPTSNHNRLPVLSNVKYVVYHLVPTSNHNRFKSLGIDGMLFIILFLHQTTTS